MVCICSNYICYIRCAWIFIPNFQDIKYQPLLGYAAFLAIMSLLISFLITWYFTRNWRKEREARKLESKLKDEELGRLLCRKDKK